MFPWIKTRSKLGKWIDRKGITQEWLVKESGLSRNSISDLCDGTVSSPRSTTRTKIVKALQQKDPNLSVFDLW